MNNTCAVVLCGGKGTRLKNIISDRPKPMAEVGGRPFLDIILEYLEANGIKDIILCTGFMSEYIKRYYTGRKMKAALYYSEEASPMGTAGAVKLAEKFIKSDTFFVLNGDSLCNTELKPMLDFHSSRNSEATVLLSRMADIRDYGSVETDGKGKIVKFLEKQRTAKPGLVNAGTYLLSKETLGRIPSGRKVSFEYDIFPSLKDIYGFSTDKGFIDIGTEERLAEANRIFGVKA